jgi:hypothetical protein
VKQLEAKDKRIKDLEEQNKVTLPSLIQEKPRETQGIQQEPTKDEGL